MRLKLLGLNKRFYCFVVSKYELGLIIKIKIKRARVRLLYPKLGIIIRFYCVVGHVITLERQKCLRMQICNSFSWLNLLISYETLPHFIGNK